jgi:hypothetical protein
MVLPHHALYIIIHRLTPQFTCQQYKKCQKTFVNGDLSMLYGFAQRFAAVAATSQRLSLLRQN